MKKRISYRALWLPLVVFTILVAISAGIWFFSQYHEKETLRIRSELTAQQVAIRLEEFLDVRLRLVENMGGLWKRGLIDSPETFTDHALTIQERFSGLLAINRVDPDGVIRWVVPEEANRAAKGGDLREHPGAAATFARAERTLTPQITPPIRLLQGGRGIAAYFPVVIDGRVEGYMNAVFRLAPLIEDCLSRGVTESYSFLLRDGGDVVYASDSPETFTRNPFVSNQGLKILDRIWIVTLAPKPETVAAARPVMDDLALLAGLLLAFGLAWLLRRLSVRDEAVRESERRFRGVFEQTFQFIGLVGVDGRIQDMNRTALEFFGVPENVFVGRLFWESPLWGHSPVERRRVREATREAAGGKLVRLETTVSDAAGAVFTIDLSIKPIRGDGGRVTLLIPEGRDITDRKKAEEALKQSEQKFRALADSTTALLLIVSDDNRLLYANQAALDVTGYTLEELEQQVARQSLLVAEDRERLQRAAEDVRAGVVDIPRKVELRMVCKDGEQRILETTGTPLALDGALAWLTTHFDITERKRAEEALRESEAENRALVNAIPDLIFQFDREGRFLRYKAARESTLILPPDEFLGKKVTEVLPEEIAELTLRNIRAALETGEIQVYEYAMPLPAGSEGEFEARLVASGGGEVLAIVRDITERKASMRALKESEEKFRTIFDNTGAATVAFGDDAVITLANQEWANLMGYEREDIEGKMTWMDFVSPDDLERMMRYHQKRSHDPESAPRAYEMKGIDRWGGERDGILTIAMVPGTRQRVASFIDITGRKAAEKQMFHAEKMAALGQIIAGVAHEINNPNNFITFNLPILKRYLDAVRPILDGAHEKDPGLTILNMEYDDFMEDVYKLLDNMQHGSERITNIVSELKTYIRGTEEDERHPADLRRVIDRAMVLVGKQVKKMVRRLDVHVEDGLPYVAMNPGRIEQVLINLLINAGQAADKDESWVRLTVRRADDGSAELSVEDNGAGIPSAALDKIFDPFYTTKGREAGTGLGLSISQRIIMEHGGRIQVHSREGEGTLFTIRLPAHEEES